MKIPALKQFDLVEIVLTDLTGIHGWRDVSDIEHDKAWVIHLVGFYINHDTEQLRACSTYVPSDVRISDVHLVPTRAIISVRKLR